VQSPYAHPIPDPVAAARRAAQQRFLGEELSADELGDTPWLVKAVLSGAPPVEITRDGVIPPRASRLLPLRHGLTRTGAPASCLLGTPGLARLRTDEAAGDEDVECGACRAWQRKNGVAPRRSSTPIIARLRAAIDVFTSSAWAGG
jgi:hypothetical protein